MSYRLKQVLQALKSQQGVKACGGTLTTPPPMPKKLPPLIKLLTKNVPRTQRDCPHVFFRGGLRSVLKEKKILINLVFPSIYTIFADNKPSKQY